MLLIKMMLQETVSNESDAHDRGDTEVQHDIVHTGAADLVIFTPRDTPGPSTEQEPVTMIKERAASAACLVLPDDLKQNLECPVCARISLPPIMQCRNGHVTCNPCRLKVQSCPMCREIDIDIR